MAEQAFPGPCVLFNLFSSLQPPFSGPLPVLRPAVLSMFPMRPSQCPLQDLTHMPRARCSQGWLLARMFLPKWPSPTTLADGASATSPHRPTHSLARCAFVACLTLSTTCPFLHESAPLAREPKTAGAASVSPMLCLWSLQNA